MVNFGDALRKGLSFSVEPKRWVPLLISDAIFAAILIFVLLTDLSRIIEVLAEAESDAIAGMSLAGHIAAFILLGAAWFLVKTWLSSALIHQSKRPREFDRSFKISLNNLHKIVAATFLIGLMSSLLGMIPVAGTVIAFVLSWAFFFAMQGIILDKLGVVSTLKHSWRIFKKKPFDVFIAWLLIAIISTGIMLVFALPFILYFFNVFVEMTAGNAETATFAMIMVYLQNNMLAVVGTGLIALVGMSISQVFSIKAQTEFYLQLRKKFPSIFKAFSRKVGRFF